MAKRRRSGVPKLKGSLTLATSISGPVFFRSLPEVRRLIGIGPKKQHGQARNNPRIIAQKREPFARDCGISTP
jgi:hypothetical protein